jgi:hypothetical protein
MVALTDIDMLQRELVRDLHQVVDMLGRQGESRWAEWLADDCDLIRHGDIFGLDHLLSAFAGIGSINDLWLSRTTSFTPRSSIDHEQNPDRARATNDTLQLLLRHIWERASLLRRALRASDPGDLDGRRA